MSGIVRYQDPTHDGTGFTNLPHNMYYQTRRTLLRSIAERRGLDGEGLVRTSRLTARVDNNAIADGFQIYLLI